MRKKFYLYVLGIVCLAALVIAGKIYFFPERQRADLTSGITVTFKGVNGQGIARIDSNDVAMQRNDSRTKKFLNSLTYKVEPDSDLSNGDKVKVIVGYSEEKAKSANIEPLETERIFTVSGLEKSAKQKAEESGQDEAQLEEMLKSILDEKQKEAQGKSDKSNKGDSGQEKDENGLALNGEYELIEKDGKEYIQYKQEPEADQITIRQEDGTEKVYTKEEAERAIQKKFEEAEKAQKSADISMQSPYGKGNLSEDTHKKDKVFLFSDYGDMREDAVKAAREYALNSSQEFKIDDVITDGHITGVSVHFLD